jgi:preprotein translocase subunit SecG
MLNVLLTVHMIACVALVIAIMLQRSEGGALGMSGGGTGGLISGRGAAGVLVRVTMVLATIFFITSIGMTYLNNQANTAPTLLERQADESANPFDTLTTPATPGAPVDPLGGATTTPPASTAPSTTPAPAPAAPAPDPLAPSNSAPTTPATPAPAAPAPATTAPTTPAPTPENGGSPN